MSQRFQMSQNQMWVIMQLLKKMRFLRNLGVGSGDATTDTNEIPEGKGSGGMMPNNGDPDNLNDPSNGDPENLDDPNNEANPVNPDDPKAEIEALRQQLAQANEALARST